MTPENNELLRRAALDACKVIHRAAVAISSATVDDDPPVVTGQLTKVALLNRIISEQLAQLSNKIKALLDPEEVAESEKLVKLLKDFL